MPDTESYAREFIYLSKLAQEIQQTINKIGGGSFGWSVEQITTSYLHLFSRFCPFDIGDRVELATTPDISKTSGWHHARHFLIEGSPATVVHRGYDANGFNFSLQFDRESWFDRAGQERHVEPEKRGLFVFGERDVRSPSIEAVVHDAPGLAENPDWNLDYTVSRQEQELEISERELIQRAIRNASPPFVANTPRWVVVKRIFGCGKTLAVTICERYGFDPEKLIAPSLLTPGEES